MQIERLRKIVLIGVVVLVILIIGVAIYYGFSATKSSNEKAQVQKVSDSLVKAWYNYDKQSVPGYQTKIKPYLTTDFYNATSQANTTRPQDFVDQLPLTSTITKTTTTAIDDSTATVVVKIASQEKGGSKYDTTVTLSLEKTGSNWLISNLEEQ